ncbi:outer envelope pore protein 37, chloroplastic [Cryptomeria japonica]|uniref:outer envelope pore protein 37, chloroplastic n=1 Tax=Cryptomeria japonica TaxID=3369 RepID=UPI0027DAB547|nr:outer envelope pore protein 37, chloroplastic [Cryptomeria japonica]XP_057855306.2 outer envelope pore protein 37, chloroplastic [Cryptomeria japonica]XP_057855307.2 outer envelope pore protein 37, chloroplastic [Cryptomeria japonica]
MAEVSTEAAPLPEVAVEPEKIGAIDVHPAKFGRDWRRKPAFKISTEFDSESKDIINKFSARLFDGLGKIKGSFQRDLNGKLQCPQLGLDTKYLSILYDHEDRNALFTASADLSNQFQLKLQGDAKAQQGELKLITKLCDSKYKAEVSYDVPSTRLPRASVTFPGGEVKLVDEAQEEGQAYSVHALLAKNFMNGLCSADFQGESLNLKYAYKDKEMTLIPSINLPSKDLTFAFKRRFNPLNKLSYLYNFNSAAWSAVYKHKPNDAFKIKVGYDSHVRVGWASAWVGKEEAGAKSAPGKVKFQLMLQVPQDDIGSYAVLFRVKKRWDF